jgi:hypothetical protein
MLESTASSSVGKRAASGVARKLWVLAASAVVVGLAVETYRTRKAMEHVHKASSELDTLRADLSRVEQSERGRTIVIRESREETEAVPSAMPAPAAGKDQDSSDLSPEEKEHRKSVINRERLALLDNTHGGEPVDPEWSSQAVLAIKNLTSDEAFSALKLAADCRSTLCRVDLSYTDQGAGIEASKRLFSSPPWRGQRFRHIDMERQQGSWYIARAGFELPTVDPATLSY